MSKSQGNNYHVVPHADGWATRREGADRADSVHRTQREAIGRARDLARERQSEVVIHGTVGRIRDKDSYGNDPNPPKDNKH